MAVRYAVATGNWSAVGTWDGGTTLPTVGDVVHPNGFVVTIDQDITVGTLTNASNGSPAVAAGGNFSVTTSRTITANITNGHATVTLIQTTDGDTVYVNGNLTGGSGAAMSMNSSSTLSLNGDIAGSASGNFNGLNKTAGTATGIWTINGNITAGMGHGVDWTTGLSAVTVNGNVTGSNTTASKYGLLHNNSGTLIVNGTVKGGTASSAFGIYTTRGSWSTTVDVAEGAGGTGYSTGMYNGVIQSGGAMVTVKKMVAGPNGQMGANIAWRVPSAGAILEMRDTSLLQREYTAFTASIGRRGGPV